MTSSQYGREFTRSHYEKVQKVYSIWICMNPPENRVNTITRYRLMEVHLVGEAVELIGNYDLLSVIVLCLGGPASENYDGVIRMLDVLLSNDRGEKEKRDILQNDFDIQMTQTMEQEVSIMCNLSSGIERKGVEKGMKMGRAEGRIEGAAETILSSIRSLMKTMGMTIEQAMTVLEVPESDRQKYLELLEKQ